MWADRRVPTCLSPGCCAPAANGHLLCWPHWSSVPRKLRDECWDAWKQIGDARSPMLVTRFQNAWLTLSRDVLFAVGATAADLQKKVLP